MGKTNYLEQVVFVIRETGWTLEYVMAMGARTFYAFLRELRFQKSVDEYNRNFPVAALVVSMGGSTVEDLIGPCPQREEDRVTEEDIWKIAIKFGLKIPSIRPN